MRLARSPILPCVLLLAACASTPRQPAAPDMAAQWREQIVAISAGSNSAGRGQAIAAMRLPWREQALKALEAALRAWDAK